MKQTIIKTLCDVCKGDAKYRSVALTVPPKGTVTLDLCEEHADPIVAVFNEVKGSRRRGRAVQDLPVVEVPPKPRRTRGPNKPKVATQGTPKLKEREAAPAAVEAEAV